jgi:MacB-like periplasmic core domain
MRDWKQIVRDRISVLHLEAAAELDLAEELGHHLEDRYRELRSAGASEEDAYSGALAELENLHPLQQKLRREAASPDGVVATLGDARKGNLLDDAWKDLRYAARSMRKSPLFVLFVVLTLGLGIGANTTVFTVINTLILNPLPVPNGAELASLALTETKNTSKTRTMLPLSHADLRDYQARNQAFRSIAGYTPPHTLTLEASGGSERVFCELVTGNYFSTLGIRPAAGRFFRTEEDGTPGEHPVAVISYGAWQSRFGGAPDVIGKTLRLNNLPFTVIGVAAPGFIGVNGIFGPDLWIPQR